MSNNPLINHFRKTEVYIPLPSQGKYYNTDLELNVDNEVAVHAMTIKDEIEIKGADALYNGEALYNLIESCVPTITDAKNMPSCDVDALLLGIKYASFGSSIDLSVNCNHCAEENIFTVDLMQFMGRITALEPREDTFEIENATIQIKPYTLQSSIESILIGSKNAQLAQVLGNNELSDAERQTIFSEVLVDNALKLTDSVANSIISVTIDEVAVSDRKFIHEWLLQISRAVYKDIKDHITDLSKHEIDKTLTGVCQKCEKDINTVFEIDPFRFFI